MSRPAETVLRTLAPALKRLHEMLQAWLALPRSRPLSVIDEAELNSLADDLLRQAEALGRERIVLNIVLMGGTGVGKSTLLNALAGAAIASASVTRPTTRDPVVYYHDSLRPEQLEKPLHGCRLVVHDRPALENKVLVDTPDLDSNEQANRARLAAILPVADIVLYVGSQEKYHDKLGWELFLKHRPRRGFAFVLNKWDRCQIGLQGGGLRPDLDLLEDLRREGFPNPLLFRTCAQSWVEANGQEPRLPEGEQFRELVQWLEDGLTQREIEAIKARGVYELLNRLEAVLMRVRPEDLTEAAARARRAWDKVLRQETQEMADILLKSLDSQAARLESFFRDALYEQFKGLMGGFLRLRQSLRHVLETLSKLFPWEWIKKAAADAEPADTGDLILFIRSLTDKAAERHLDARTRALPNKLLVVADENAFPLTLLSSEVQQAAQTDWRARYSTVVANTCEEIEAQWTSPTGLRRGLLNALIWAGEWLPILLLLAGILVFLNNYLPLWETSRTMSVWEGLALLIALPLISLILLWLPIRLFLPIRWKKIRSLFHGRLREQLMAELGNVFLPLPEREAERVRQERQRLEALLQEALQVRKWLEAQEKGQGTAVVERIWGQAASPARPA